MTTEQVAIELTPCRLCGADEADDLWWDHDKDFGLPGRFLWVQCRGCGAIYLRSRPTPEFIGVFYPPDYAAFRRAIQDEKSPFVRWSRNRNPSRRCGVVEQHSRRRVGRILDVGCATGIFLDAMRQRGWTTTGVEINAPAADYARKRFGLEVFEGSLTEAHFEASSYDVVTLWDVLEHTFDPLLTLQEAHRLLVPGGIVALTLPHWESLDRLLFKQHWAGYDCPRHLFVIPRQVLLSLLARSAFEPVHLWCGLGGYYMAVTSLRFWLNENVANLTARNTLIRSVYFPGFRFLLSPLFYFLDRLNAGPTLTIVAKKVGGLNLP